MMGLTARLKAIVRWMPTIFVYAALGGIAWWGHHNDWRLPTLSQLMNRDDPTATEWCIVHHVPESDCVECDGALVSVAPDFGWCDEHGLHQCTLCHPEVAQLEEPPVISPQRMQAAEEALALLPRDENSGTCTLYQTLIQFASSQAATRAGVAVIPAETQRVVEQVRANGEVTYDATQRARVSPRAAGTVLRIFSEIGDHVSKGQVLALVDAREVGAAKSELETARAQLKIEEDNFRRIAPLATQQVISQRELVEAEQAVAQAQIRVKQGRQALGNLGFALQALDEDQLSAHLPTLGVPDEIRSQLTESELSNNMLPIVAPVSGTVIARDAVVGEVVATTSMLFEIADTSRMWLTLQVSAEDAALIRKGHRVRFQLDGSGDQIESTIDWISTQIDPHTRTVAMRAIVPNAGALRNDAFGTGEIILREDPEAVVIPREAVHWDGNCHVVFVRDKNYLQKDAPKLFHVRSVRPGVEVGAGVEIVAGLLPGEMIVSEGSGALRAQLLRSRLGEGCTCH